MRNSSWNDLTALIEGKTLNYRPVGFIIDSPWLPGWYGISTIDYYSSDELWLKSNLKAVNTFSGVWFMPGFWAEFGMCSEPSAFGSRMIFHENSLPYSEKVLVGIEESDSLPQPNVKTDGLLPLIISRLKKNQRAIIEAGHQIRFAVSRGPLNIASFLLGTSELMMAMVMNPEETHKLLKKITLFVCDWLSWQKENFPKTDGVLILDDIIGFVGENEFCEFVLPYYRQIFSSTGVKVRFLHNDADGLITAKYLSEMGVNVFNFSYRHSLRDMRELTGSDVVLMGNIAPRDVLAGGSPGKVCTAVKNALNDAAGDRQIIWSCGGGMPQNVRDINIHAFIETVGNYEL